MEHDDEEMIDIESWDKCPHGYYIDPEDGEMAIIITGEDENGDPEIEACEECLIDRFSEHLIEQGEDPCQVQEFSKFQKSTLSIERLLDGSQE